MENDMKKKLETLSLSVLKDFAKDKNIKKKHSREWIQKRKTFDH